MHSGKVEIVQKCSWQQKSALLVVSTLKRNNYESSVLLPLVQTLCPSLLSFIVQCSSADEGMQKKGIVSRGSANTTKRSDQKTKRTRLKPGKPHSNGRICTVDLLVPRLSCFLMKTYSSPLPKRGILAWRSIVRSRILQRGLPAEAKAIF